MGTKSSLHDCISEAIPGALDNVGLRRIAYIIIINYRRLISTSLWHSSFNMRQNFQLQEILKDLFSSSICCFLAKQNAQWRVECSNNLYPRVYAAYLDIN